MVDAYYGDLGVLRDDFVNPFRGLSLGETPDEKWQEVERKLALPIWWILEVLYDPIKTAGLNAEGRDIAILCAELGTRENEIHDLPPEAIVLDHPIPHLILDVVLVGEHRRELKNRASKRKVPLTPRALAIMRKYPHGFTRYRNTANYSNTVNKNFRKNSLFPVCKEDPTRRYTIGGLRHTFEDRMWHAKIDNEMRAFMMGHSIEAIRGRPVYGTALELPLRVLLLEKIAFPTKGWVPRSHQEIDAEIDRLLEEDGFRRH
jgi:integrase